MRRDATIRDADAAELNRAWNAQRRGRERGFCPIRTNLTLCRTDRMLKQCEQQMRITWQKHRSGGLVLVANRTIIKTHFGSRELPRSSNAPFESVLCMRQY